MSSTNFTWFILEYIDQFLTRLTATTNSNKQSRQNLLEIQLLLIFEKKTGVFPRSIHLSSAERQKNNTHFYNTRTIAITIKIFP